MISGIDAAEEATLQRWVDESEINKDTVQYFFEAPALRSNISDLYKSKKYIWARLESAISKQDARSEKVVPIRSNKFIFRWAVAAAILLFGAFAIYQLTQKKSTVQPVSLAVSDVKPPSQITATITLADGKVVSIDSIGQGFFAQQGNADIMHGKDGSITYENNGATAANVQPLYNTLYNPPGSRIVKIILADGSGVWLNAGTSLKYPVSFAGNYRQVEITGEAYFEVTKNKKQPFKVQVPGRGEVEVLGTHFNINAYTDEATMNTTLLEGSVRVAASNGSTATLAPNQQAQLAETITVLDNIDTDEIMAWKEGWFNFNRTDITGIMRQLSRWYVVDVSYEGVPTKKYFSGIVSRDNNISEVLKMMEGAGVHFKIDGRKITVIQ